VNQFSGNFNKRRSGRRDTLLLLAGGAFLFSLVIVTMVVVAMKRKDSEKIRVAAIEVAAQQQVKSSSVVVPVQTVPRGEQLKDFSFQAVLFPVESIPAGALGSTDGVLELFADVELAAGKPVLPTMLTKDKPPSTIKITPGMRAVTIAINSQSGLEGWAQPGTRVDVVLTFTENSSLTSKVIVQNARVLSYDGESTAARLESRRIRMATGNNLTLEVSPEDALKIQTSQQLGSLSLLLRAPEDNKASAVTEVSKSQIAGGTSAESAAQATPECNRGTMTIAGKAYLIDCNGKILAPAP
jgi:pilus assembly protein CpaB